MKESKSSKKVK